MSVAASGGASVAAQVARLVGSEPRPPCSDAEREAAERLRDWLLARGDAAEIRPAVARVDVVAARGIGGGLGVAGSLVGVGAPLAGLACAALSAAVLALDAAGAPLPFMPRRPTQDVVVAPSTEAPVTLIVTARYDSPRRAAAHRLAGVLVVAALALIAAVAARAGGAGGIWLGALQLLPTLALLAGLGTALDAALAGWTSGEPSAAAAAVATAIHDELAGQRPRHLAPALLLYGAGATGPQALRSRLRTLAPEPAHAVVLEVLPGGAPRARTSHPQLRNAAARATAALHLPPAARLPPSPRLGRVPVVRVGAGGPEATASVDLGLAIADALDARL